MDEMLLKYPNLILLIEDIEDNIGTGVVLAVADTKDLKELQRLQDKYISEGRDVWIME